MVCSVDGRQVRFSSPEEIRGFSASFTPDAGKLAACSCTVKDAFKCSGRNGFTCEEIKSTVQITVPESFRAAGKFIYQFKAMDSSECRWSPSDDNIVSGTSPSPEITTGTTEPFITEFCLAILIGICFGICIGILIRHFWPTIVKKIRSCLNIDATDHGEYQGPIPMRELHSNSERSSNEAAAAFLPGDSHPDQLELWNRECYTSEVFLDTDQNYLVATIDTPLLKCLITGPPGTGKTVVLFWKGKQWIQHGYHVYVVSTWEGSLAACKVLKEQLKQSTHVMMAGSASPRLQLLHYDFNQDSDIEEAINYLSDKVEERSLFVLADNADPRKCSGFKTFCEKLQASVPELNLWAASRVIEDLPNGWEHKELSIVHRSESSV